MNVGTFILQTHTYIKYNKRKSLFEQKKKQYKTKHKIKKEQMKNINMKNGRQLFVLQIFLLYGRTLSCVNNKNKK